MDDRFYMQLALNQARIAKELGEVPVGAVLVQNDRVLSMAFNRREIDRNALAHAEILAIDDACKTLGGWRLFGSVLYVTLEPCPMCAGAIINARIDRVVYATADPKAGSVLSVTGLFELGYNHHPEVTSGICAEESAELLTNFFQSLRRGKSGA